MKTLKIYSVIATLILIGLSVSLYLTKKDLKETEEVLEQCSARYYKEIGK
jgi:hypothetical protein